MRVDLPLTTIHINKEQYMLDERFNSFIPDDSLAWLIENVGPILHQDGTTQLGQMASRPYLIGIGTFKDDIMGGDNSEYLDSLSNDKAFHWHEMIIGDGWSMHCKMTFDLRWTNTRASVMDHHFVTIEDENMALMFKLTWG